MLSFGNQSMCSFLKDDLRTFKAISDIKTHFEAHQIPIEITELQLPHEKWVFVAAYPYSGMNTIDLYAYVFRKTSWDLFSQTFLMGSKTMKARVKADGEFINIFHDDVLVMRINSTKAAAQ